MYAIENLGAFIIAGILLNLTPGQDTLYILGQSLSNGRKAGIISVFGISTGALIHILFASLGLSAILMTSALLFSIIKYIGAAYLIYLGVSALRKRTKNPKQHNFKHGQMKYDRIYRRGIITNLLNPKVAIFFLSFLPQFINPSYTSSPIPFVILGGIFICTGTIWCIVVALASSSMAQLLNTKPIFRPLMEKIAGSIFILLGLKLAFEKNN